MIDARINVSRHLVAVFAIQLLMVLAVVESAAEGNRRAALHVQVDREARMYLDGARVDTLAVSRGQIIYWEKSDKDGPDLKVLFDRKLFHPRNWTRVIITEEGRPRFVRVDDRARMRLYAGTPEKGFMGPEAGLRSLFIRIVPPPTD